MQIVLLWQSDIEVSCVITVSCKLSNRWFSMFLKQLPANSTVTSTVSSIVLYPASLFTEDGNILIFPGDSLKPRPAAVAVQVIQTHPADIKTPEG